MAQPTTAKFGKMRVLIGAFPSVSVAATSLSNANPAVVTVGGADIGKFHNGDEVEVTGATGTGMTVANGRHTIANVTATTFSLVGVDTSTGAAPQTTGVTVDARDTAGAITYAAPCGFTSKGVTISKNLQEVSIPDCDDEDAPIWLGRDVQNQSCTITGDGVAAAESVPDWDQAAMTTEAVPMKVEIEFTGVGTKTIAGNFHVDSEAFTADAGGRVSLAINAQSDGAVTADWTAM